MNIILIKKYDLYVAFVCLCFSLCAIIGFDGISATLRQLVFPMLIIYSLKRAISKNSYLILFLISFGFAEACYYLTNILDRKWIGNLENLGNTSLLLGYIFLITLIVSKLNLKLLFKRFIIQIIILSTVGIYLFFELNSMVFSRGETNISVVKYLINLFYNLVIVVLLGISLLNYFYHDSMTAFRLLIACTVLVFSEFVQTAFYYVGNRELLHKTYTILLSISYFSFFLYIRSLKEKMIVYKNQVDI